MKKIKKIGLDATIALLRQQHYSAEEILDILSGHQKEDIRIPLAVFAVHQLGMLEIMATYLHDERKLTFQESAAALNRHVQTICSSYRRARQKYTKELPAAKSKILVPVSLFRNRAYTVLENLVSFLREYGLSNHQIAVMLKRRDSTISTIWQRYRKKSLILTE